MSETITPPTRGRWLGLRLSLMVTICGLLLWSVLGSSFVPSAYGQSIALGVAIGMGLLAGAGSWFDPVLAHDTPERAAMVARRPFLKDRATRTVCLGVISALATFEAVNGAGLELWTLATGHAGERPLHLGDYRSSSRGNCAGFQIEEAPLKIHRVICARYPSGEDPPEPGTPVMVWGKASDVGIRVERFEIGSRP